MYIQAEKGMKPPTICGRFWGSLSNHTTTHLNVNVLRRKFFSIPTKADELAILFCVKAFIVHIETVTIEVHGLDKALTSLLNVRLDECLR